MVHSHLFWWGVGERVGLISKFEYKKITVMVCTEKFHMMFEQRAFYLCRIYILM